MENKSINLTKTARIAGLLYLINAITAAIGIIIIPARIIVAGDVAATALNILNNEFLYRIGILSSLSGQITFIFLALVLYNLFENVSIRLARSLLVIVITSVPVAFFIIFNQVSALSILKENFTQSFDQMTRYSLSMSYIKSFENGIIIIGIFWGLWLLPFGQLVYKSGFIPKVLGVLLIAGGVSYLIDVITFILLPELHAQTTILVGIASSVAEISMVLWLLIIGVKRNYKVIAANN